MGLIIAKGKSKRLEGKNRADFNGKPMFLWNVEKCLNIFSRVYVSSDDHWILEEAENAGAIPIKRGEELCGEVPNVDVYKHALQFMNGIDAIVAVQANSPNVNSKLIQTFKYYIERGVNEIITCHRDGKIYGSIWGMTRDRLLTYKDPYNPSAEVILYDPCEDIHTIKDLEEAKKNAK